MATTFDKTLMDPKAPQFVEPRRALQKAMASRAKTSHLGAFQILPEHVVLSCLARLPREDHDAIADCSTGFRAIMRSERFLKARRAEEITEEALVVITCANDSSFLALVSGRIWRRLAPMPAEMRISFSATHGVARMGTTAIGSELFLAGGMKQDGTYHDVSVYDALDDEWFTMPLDSSSYPRAMDRELFAVGVAGRLYVGELTRYDPYRGRVLIQSFDPDAQRWVDLPPMPPPLPRIVPNCWLSHQLVAVVVDEKIFVLDRCDAVRFRVFDTYTETWSSVAIPDEVTIVDPRDSPPDLYSKPWPSLYVDRSLIHVLEHPTADPGAGTYDTVSVENPDGPTPGAGNHYAYDTVSGEWLFFHGGLPRHTVCSESDRVLSVINDSGFSNDYIYDANHPQVRKLSSRGRVCVCERNVNDLQLTDTTSTGLPVRYDVVERVVYVAMP